jgi:DNA primase
MNSDLDEIKNRVDIVELVSDHVPLKRAGQNYKGLCPFHSEKTPSFMVSPVKQIFHCFGCGAGGDIFGFVMKYEGVEFRDALEMLAKRAGVELKKLSPGQQGLRQELKAMQKEAVRFYADCLSRSETAMKYLKQRGIEEGVWKDFSLGYAPPGWHNVRDHLKGKGFPEDRIMQSGLVAAGNKGPYDIFRERILFPIFDMHGEAIAFGGRVMGDAMPKYLNSPDTPLFRKGETLYALSTARDGIREKGYSIVVEGYLDAIMCHQYGLDNAVAPLGTALTQGHLRKLGRLAGNVLLIFDGDQAGVAAAKRSLPPVMEQGLRAKVLLLPEGEDPDSLLREKGPEHMKGLIAGASTPVDFFLRTQKTGRLEAINEAVETISKVGDPIVRDELILELSDRTRVSERSIRDKLARFRKTGSHVPDRPKQRPYDEETLLLSAAVALPERAEEIAGQISPDDMRDPVVRALLLKLGREHASVGALMGTDGIDEERTLLGRLSVNPGFDVPDADRVIEDCIRKITRRRVDEKIKTAEMAGDLKLLTRLLSERQRLMHGAE